jgi:hypothetical protein
MSGMHVECILDYIHMFMCHRVCRMYMHTVYYIYHMYYVYDLDVYLHARLVDMIMIPSLRTRFCN